MGKTGQPSLSRSDAQDFSRRQMSSGGGFRRVEEIHDRIVPPPTPFTRTSPVMEGLVRAFVEKQGISIDIDAASLEPILMLSWEDMMSRRASHSGTVGCRRVDNPTRECLINIRLPLGHSASRANRSSPSSHSALVARRPRLVWKRVYSASRSEASRAFR